MKILMSGSFMEIICSPPFTSKSLQELLKLDIQIPKALLHEIRMSKTVTINGKEPNWVAPLKENDHIQFKVILDEEITPSPSKGKLEILFEDEHLLIVNKPINMDTHPSSSADTSSLSNLVAYHFQQHGIFQKVRHIHRLDKDTSGAILFAKHALSGALLDRLLEKREIKRTYVALVEGIITINNGTIKKPIGKDRHQSNKRVVAKTGQHAITHFSVIERFLEDNMTLVELSLETGRTHQIRVHMSSMGHPLVGDKLYGSKENNNGRHALHAWKLQVPTPFGENLIRVTAPVPDNFCKNHHLLNKIKFELGKR